jgi:SAM-dependent methyltransferase
MTSPSDRILVHYGAGLYCAPVGWLNFDASPTLRLERLPILGRFIHKNATRFPANILPGDIIKGLPVAPGSADCVYCSHILEHLSRADCHTALKNTFDLLKPGGIFRLVLPDTYRLAVAYIGAFRVGDQGAVHRFMNDLGMGEEVGPRGLKGLLVSWLGSVRHRWMWDVPSMTEALVAAGFAHIRICSFGDSEDPAFQAVEDRTRFFAADGTPELALEAWKPCNEIE